MDYTKRKGTAGISGQLYETKVLSLLLFRLQYDVQVEHFYLSTNMNEAGSFDDICLKIKIVDMPTAAVFIQLKHKDNDNASLMLTGKDKVKYIDSFLKIKDKIASQIKDKKLKKSASQKNRDIFFDGSIKEENCFCILYTNGHLSLTNSDAEFKSSYATTLNNLIATSDTVGYRPHDSDQYSKDFGDIFLEKDLTLLAEQFVKFLSNTSNGFTNVQITDQMLQYHVILQQKVVALSDVHVDENKDDLKWRILTFRKDFFDNADACLILFKYKLIEAVLKRHPNIRRSNELTANNCQSSVLERSENELVSSFLGNPSVANLIPLIVTHITCNEDGKLNFLVPRPPADTESLKQINMPQSEIDEATTSARAAAIMYLRSLLVKVPVAFGNVDLTISGSVKKIERRIDHLVNALVDLCKQCEHNASNKIIRIDDTLDDGLLRSNGGLAGAVGNLLIYDQETKMLKFANNYTSLQRNANNLFQKLKVNIKEMNNELGNIHEYKFNVTTEKFPKLCLDCTSTAKDFLSKLIIYEKQSNQFTVETLLKDAIEKHLNDKKTDKINHHLMNAYSVFLHYHDEVLKWWIGGTGTYLSKDDNLYDRAKINLMSEPKICDLYTTFYMNNLKYFTLTFKENTIKSMNLRESCTAHPSKIFIVTDTVVLTTMRVIQCLRYNKINDYTILDSEAVFNLPNEDDLYAELKVTRKVVIIVFHKSQNISNLDISKLAKATERNKIVVISSNELMALVKDSFSKSSIDVLKNETESLITLSIESQKKVKEDAKIVFQGKEISAELIFDDVSVSFVAGIVLDKIVRRDTLHIGAALSDASYEKRKHLYMGRTLRPVTETSVGTYDSYEVDTFHDISDEVVLVTAASGMGKSTLVTHLSLETKDCDMKLWIVRMNFLDHRKWLSKWYDDKTVINAEVSLTFLCQVILHNTNTAITVEIRNDTARLVCCDGDELSTFQLKMFLHFYNERRVIFVFDGFDEICPLYKDKALDFLEVTKTLRKKKMWVTSRPYSDILPDLQRVLGKGYTIEHFDFFEQALYAAAFWRERFIFDEFNENQRKNFKAYLDNMLKIRYKPRSYWISNFDLIFRNIVKPYIYPTEQVNHNKLQDGVINLDEDIEFIEHLEKGESKNVKVNNLTGVPLILYFVADYFMNICNQNITDVEMLHDTRQLDANIHNIYEIFITNKFKNFFQEKNGMDLTYPYIQELFKEKLSECVSTHKKLAAHALLHVPLFQTLDLEEFKEMNPLNDDLELNNLLSKMSNIGLMLPVADNNQPVFIHRSFTEYFASKYICDILKSNKFNVHQKTLLHFVVLKYCDQGLKDWFHRKEEIDENLSRVVKEIEDKMPLYKRPLILFINAKYLSKSHFIRMMSSTVEDYESDSFEKCFKLCAELYESEKIAAQKLPDFLISQMRPHLKKYFLQD